MCRGNKWVRQCAICLCTCVKLVRQASYISGQLVKFHVMMLGQDYLNLSGQIISQYRDHWGIASPQSVTHV